MTDRETVAFRAGLRHAAEMALLSALALEMRPDQAHVRQQAAIAALRGLATGLEESAEPPSRLPAIMAAVAANPATSGAEVCPECSGRLAWIKDDSNGHVHIRCESAGCIVVIQ